MELSVIQSKIYEIRGCKVMLDFDLAEMYQVETKQLKRTVRRNIERFEDEDFMFEVTIEELSRCQFGTLNKGRGYNIKYLSFAFTELGVAMLSSVLNSDTAIKINRSIMRAFVAVRNYLYQHAETSREIAELWNHVKQLEKRSEENLKAINDMDEDNQKSFDEIYYALSQLAAKQKTIPESKPRKRVIGFTQYNKLEDKPEE